MVLWGDTKKVSEIVANTCREDIVNKHVPGFRSKFGYLQLINPPFAR
jgi:hypothetical protein